MKEAEKIHRALWKMEERLEKDQQELKKIEVERAQELANEALGEETVDAGLSRKLVALRVRVKEEGSTLDELCSRHREVLQVQLAEEAERGWEKVAALQAKREDAQIAHAKALGEAMVCQAKLEELNAACANLGGYMAPTPGPFIVGTTEEVLETAKTNPALAVDPRSLTEALARLEDRPLSFGGNAVTKVEDRIYIPCLGRIHIEFDPATGQVTKSDVLSTMAIEARQENGFLVAAEGAAPVKLEEPPQSGPVFNLH